MNCIKCNHPKYMHGFGGCHGEYCACDMSPKYVELEALRARFPAPKTVMVPVRWKVEGVFIHCNAKGQFVAYRGRMGASEAWEVV